MSFIKELEHKFKPFVFWIFQWIFRKGNTNLHFIYGNKVTKILIFRSKKLGDIVITYPVIDKLKKNFPQLEISLLASNISLPLAKDDPRFDKIYLFRKEIFNKYVEIF